MYSLLHNIILLQQQYLDLLFLLIFYVFITEDYIPFLGWKSENKKINIIEIMEGVDRPCKHAESQEPERAFRDNKVMWCSDKDCRCVLRGVWEGVGKERRGVEWKKVIFDHMTEEVSERVSIHNSLYIINFL